MKNPMKNPTPNRRAQITRHIETVAAGFFYVTIATVIATQVNAQGSTKITPATSGAAPSTAIKSEVQPDKKKSVADEAKAAVKAGDPSCTENQAPDAMCSLPLQQGPELKICFSIKHSRCFELKEGHLIQTLSGQVAQNSALNATQIGKVRDAIQSYRTWLSDVLGKQPKALTICRDMVSVDSRAEHKEFCLSRLPKKDVQSKTRDLFSVIEHPTDGKTK